MRYGRLVLGAGIVLASLWIIIGEQITGVSSDAVVNARISTLRAPMAGKLEMPMRPLGARFAAQETVATLSAAHQSLARLDDLELEAALQEAELSYREWITQARGSEPETSVELARNDSQFVSSDRAESEERPNDPEIALAKARLDAIRARLGQERYRVGQDAQGRLTAPVEGILWEVLAGHGEYVERGQDIATFVVCGSALVTLSVPANVYARLSVGQAATFRLDSTSTIYEGRITRMAGAGAETIYRNLAVAPSIKHLERYDVALLVPELRTSPDLECSVGRTGRVFFDSRPLDWIRAALR